MSIFAAIGRTFSRWFIDPPSKPIDPIKTSWSFDRNSDELSIVVKNEHGVMVGQKRMTFKYANAVAAQLWTMANYGGNANASIPLANFSDFSIPPTVVESNDPWKVAEALLNPTKSESTAEIAGSIIPSVDSQGPSFVVATWPLEKLKQLLDRPVRFDWVVNGINCKCTGRIIEVTPSGKNRMLTIETDIGGMVVYRGLDQCELFGGTGKLAGA